MEVFKLLGIPNKTVIWNFNLVEGIDALKYIIDPALGQMILLILFIISLNVDHFRYCGFSNVSSNVNELIKTILDFFVLKNSFLNGPKKLAFVWN